MPSPKKAEGPPADLNVGVINPYALAEAELGTSVDWEAVDSREVLQETLDTPYERLFDPKFDSPLYAGLEYDPKTQDMVKREVAAVDVGEGIQQVSEGATEADAVETDASREPESRDISDILAGVAAGAVWVDKGTFFKEGSEFSDPVQGAVGDCYLIAALSSVAWARTYDIAHRTRATGLSQQQFVDQVTFFEGAKKILVEVTETVPVNSAGNFLYARSSEAGEIWPAVYEKAYAKWRLGAPGDHPNILGIAGGDPILAAAQLTGLSRNYYATKSTSADTLWTKVRENAISRKTFNPMVAWTYSSGEKSPDKVNYGSANLVANHAYSVLGWDYRNGAKYIVLRNPWGQTEASKDLLSGTFTAWDAPYYKGPGWWRSVSLAANDGTFGLRIETFKKYFAYLAVVK
jgi:hypothetical protein